MLLISLDLEKSVTPQVSTDNAKCTHKDYDHGMRTAYDPCLENHHQLLGTNTHFKDNPDLEKR